MDNISSANESLSYQIMQNAPHDMFWIIVSAIVSLLIVSAITYYFSPRVRIFIRTWIIKIGLEDFCFSLFYKYYFKHKIKNLNADIYSKISTRFKEFNISRSSIRPESIIINPEKLGVKISIELDCINELEAEEPLEADEEKGKEYQLTIRLDSYLRLTYRRLDIFENYMSIFEEIKNIVEEECFGGERERKSFLVCDISRNFNQIYTGKDIIDNTKNTKISFMGENIKIIADKPTHLISTIKKYLGY